ncbi:MAG: YsnF/AvaK domain-containing protein [Litorimonas sp.]
MLGWIKSDKNKTLDVQPDEDLGSEAPHKTVEAVFPLAEEIVSVTSREVEGDRVRVSIDTLTDVETVSQALRTETADVERVPINRALTEIPDVRRDGDVTIIPVVRERLVLKKELVLVEEIHIRHTRTEKTVTRDVDVRRQEARVERLSPKD